MILDIVINHTGDVFDYDGFGSVAPWRDSPTYPIHWRGSDGQPDPAWADAPDNPPADAAVHPQALLRNDAFRRLGNAFGAVGHDPTMAGDFYSLKEMVTILQDESGRYLVRDALIDCYAQVMRRFDIDGYRIDTLMYVERDFALAFGNAMREYGESLGKKNFFTFGEVYADEQKISGYVGRHVGDGDLVGVDAALDFPLFCVLPSIGAQSRARRPAGTALRPPLLPTPLRRRRHQAGASTPDVTVERPAGSVSVNDGSGDSVGPICTVEISLRTMEVQILAPG